MLNIYTIYDSKVESYDTPFFMKNDGQALRAFVDLVNDPKSYVNRHPTDYVLFRIGTFDDETGLIQALPSPHHIGNAWEFVENKS